MGFGARRRFRIDHIQLHPDRLGADRDRILDDRWHLLGTAEYVHHLHRLAYGTQVLATMDQSFRQDTLLWVGGGLVVLLVVGWLFKPRRW